MLYIMRHGQTDWNVVHKLQGSTDIPLNEAGRRMAREAREKYRELIFDVCYCSPLIRARETAELFLAGSGTPIFTDERLREIGFGVCEGVEGAYKNPDCPVYAFFNDPAHYAAADGAESLDSLYGRTGSFLRETLALELSRGKNVLLVAHGAADCCIVSQYEHTPRERFWDGMLANCELRRLA